MNDLLKLAIEGHGGEQRWEQISRFRVAASVTGAIWTLKGKPADDRDHRRRAGRRAPRPRGLVRRADPLLAVGRTSGGLLRRRGQLELLRRAVPLRPFGLRHLRNRAVARGRQTWRRLLVTYPDTIVAHTRQQTRPSFEDLRRDLREVTREIRPDWDLAAPGLRENWEAGDHLLHHPYQADHGRSPSAPDMASATVVPGGA